MKHALHQFLWQIRRRPVLLSLNAVLWFVLTWLCWTYTSVFRSNPFYLDNAAATAHFVLLFLTVILAIDCAATDPAAGTDSFWRTRPPRWTAVWLGKVLFVLLALAGPLLLCWLINGLLLDFTAPQWRQALLEPLLAVSLLLVCTALRGFARGWTLSLIVFGVAGALIHSGGALIIQEIKGWPKSHNYYEPSAFVVVRWQTAFWLVMALVPAITILTVWALALRRRLSVRNIVLAVIVLVAAPAPLWHLFLNSQGRELLLTPTASGEGPALDDLPMGIVTLHGVPENRDVAVSYWFQRPPSITEVRRPRAYFVGTEPDFRSGTPAWLTPAAAARLVASLPPGTRWYSDGTGVSHPPDYALRVLSYPPPHLQLVALHGQIAGELFVPAQPFPVPLTAGSTVAKNGTRITVQTITAGSRNLEIEIAIRQARHLGSMGSGVFVLHLPAVPCALLMEYSIPSQFVALALDGAQTRLRASMPDAEFATGLRFTPEVMHAAALWHYRPIEAIPFEAKTREDDVIHYPATPPEK